MSRKGAAPASRCVPALPEEIPALKKFVGIIKSRMLAFVPAPGSALGPHRRPLTSFVRHGAGLLDCAEPLAARDGLLLLRLPPFFTLCVCSLITGKLDLLPLLDAASFDDEGVRGYAILRSADHGDAPHRPAHGYSNLCQVLLIGVHRSNEQLHIHSFSSDATASQNWSTTPANCFPGDPELFSGPYGCVAAVSHDTAHWLFKEHGSTGSTMYTVDVSVNSGSVCASKIITDQPSPFDFVIWRNARLSLTTDERLSVLYERKNHLIIWTRQDVDQSGTAAWTCTQRILVDVKELWSPGGMRFTIVCVGEKSGTVLVLSHLERNNAYLLDLQSKSTTKVAGWNGPFNYKTAVPYEINMPELFMSRLGVQL
ncbi:unnamed protein product [Urochloa humidicola]